MDEWDVLVIGSGAAGLAAAWHARAAGARVLVVNKGGVGRTGATITSGGGVSVSGETAHALGLGGHPDDTDEIFLHDTIRSGQFLSDQNLVHSMVTGIGEELKRLVATGVKIRPAGRRPPGHSSGRGVHIKGPDMQRIMTTEAVKAGTRFREDFQSVGLLSAQGRVAGVAGLDRRTGRFEAIRARSVVVATGGTTSNWKLKTAPEELSGEGQAMALAAGADLIEMEMMQFLPCCLVAPDIWRGLQFPWILGPQSGVRAWLLNKFGERFLGRWDPERMEMATRDVLSAAMAAEVFEGRGSPNGGVYISWAHLPSDIIDNFTTWSKAFGADWRWEGFDMSPLVERIRAGHAIEVAPAAHFSLGGIRIDVSGATTVPGLFACGEATGGLHGGNRLSGNAGTQILVQGREAARSAAAFARRHASPEPTDDRERWNDLVSTTQSRQGGIAPVEVKARLMDLADTALGPLRTGKSLEAALAEIRDIASNALPQLSCRSREPAWNQDLTEALECIAATSVLETSALGALRRTRSIGAHLRHDDPGTDKPAPTHSIVKRVAGELVHRVEPVTFPYLAPFPRAVPLKGVSHAS